MAQGSWPIRSGWQIANRSMSSSTANASLARLPSNLVSYYFSDRLKTADVITDAAGNIKSESDYYPWGGELPFIANDSNHYKFTGKERDAETQLDYFGARYYSNGLGRWISPDWSSAPVPVPYADLSDPQSSTSTLTCATFRPRASTRMDTMTTDWKH